MSVSSPANAEAELPGERPRRRSGRDLGSVRGGQTYLIAPYLQRAEQRPGALDRACTAVLGRLAPVFDHPSRRLHAAAIAAEAHDASAWSDAALRAALQELRPRLCRRGLASPATVTAIALFAEACYRACGLRPHRVQLMAAFALADGRFAEVPTGEGKTIVAALLAGAAALAGVPTHVVTVNDYLAERDAAFAGPILAYAGLTTGVVRHGDATGARRLQYRCDVVYVSNKELAFDYLRDRIRVEAAGGSVRREADGLILRGLHFAIVDEADSILIDEARTPLILSDGEEATEECGAVACRHALAAAAELIEHEHYRVLRHARQVSLTALGRMAVSAAAARGGVWRVRPSRESLVQHALAAQQLYRRDRDYIVHDGAIRIIDEHTGRFAEGRSWQDGLHQMIEVAEGLTASARQLTRTSITLQSFFCRYIRLAGLSGTLSEVSAELRTVYGRPTVSIPPHRPARRRDLGTRVLRDRAAQWQTVADAAAAQSAAGRPVLIGTRSVASSEELSQHLTTAGIAHRVLNARHDRQEAAVIAEAGHAGCVTVATNMAGRGTDIRPDRSALRAGGLHVILTELHDSRRVDRQLIGRGGRQGDPGTFELILSVGDVLLARYSRPVIWLLCRLARRPGALDRLGLTLLCSHAQRSVERQHRRDRRRMMQWHLQTEQQLAFAGDTP